MLKATIAQFHQRKEVLLAIASFGASSVYWLSLAFVLSAASYGKMMTLQAAVLLITNAFACRNYDLVFFLVANRGFRVESAYRLSLAAEVATVTTATAVCAAAFSFHPIDGAQPMIAIVAIYALLASLMAAQGASMAKLRYLERADIIARGDYLAIFCWCIACSTLVLFRSHPAMAMLIIGTMPVVAKTIVLWCGALLARPAKASEGRVYQRGDLRQVVRFLASGQVVNFAKNSGASIETIIVAAFCPPTSVAMYRLAKSTLGATTAATNVTYQKSYWSIANAKSFADKTSAWKHMQKDLVRISVLLYPASAIFALVYAIVKPDIGIVTFQVVTFAVFLALIPGILQQGAFIILTLHGKDRHISAGFIIGFVALIAFSALLFVVPSVIVFAIVVLLAAIVRLWYLTRKAHAVVRDDAGPPASVESRDIVPIAVAPADAA